MTTETGRNQPPKARTRRKKPQGHPGSVPRATRTREDDDVFMSGGSKSGVAYGRCGGRVLGSQLEQQICDLLSRRGIAHSHSPRHFEVRLPDATVAAYAPMIVLRGRGREGKTVVIEGASGVNAEALTKIRSFRAQYGVEFYLSFIAPEDVLDEVSLDVYDEATALTEAHTLVNRLAD